MQRTLPDFDAILNRLVKAQVDFVIIGGYAMVVLGCDNQTTDIDFAIARDRENARKTAEALAPLNPRPEGWPDELPYVWDTETVYRATILTLLTDQGSVDLMAEVPGMGDYKDLKSDSTSFTIYGVRVEVASVDRLIRMKRASNRPKDQIHVMQLLALKNEAPPGS